MSWQPGEMAGGKAGPAAGVYPSSARTVSQGLSTVAAPYNALMLRCGSPSLVLDQQQQHPGEPVRNADSGAPAQTC